MIRIVAVARLCYPGVRDEPFPLRKKSLNTRLCGDASRFLLGPLAGGKKKDLLRLLNPRHRVAVHEVERQVLEATVAAEVDDAGARAGILPVVVDDDPADGDLCMNQTVAARLRHGSIMTSTPSTRRQLDGVAVWVLVHPTHCLIYAQPEHHEDREERERQEDRRRDRPARVAHDHVSTRDPLPVVVAPIIIDFIRELEADHAVEPQPRELDLLRGLSTPSRRPDGVTGAPTPSVRRRREDRRGPRTSKVMDMGMDMTIVRSNASTRA